ncbi:MobC family plasmid mobilization relaxosome protein [Loktanella sp. F6476L]|uniref:MobC family plasmid mobilization relaxosome protein n=1 Tax=Loktanella sp. F6476L TaxID=2926405 RepID=UPI001FF52F09|nr:MobC family plasmid mobilization relaxosome protein [Loktanella sp. F6476L]MCK0119230.1 MobC family plasmid mobilization relaxosome protein [Loktanella sp. F6476L]
MWVKLRTTPDERAAWYAKAAAKGVSFSEFARSAIDGVAVRRRPQLRCVDPDLLRQLARVGNNLNQLARWANRDQQYADRVAIMVQLMGIERELMRLRQHHEVSDAD